MLRNLKISRLLMLLFLAGTNFSSAQVKDRRPPQNNERENKAYTIEQATSDRAQLHTISFNGLAFLTGNFGADCFFPPGKVADFFGFQYMRDNDSNSLGHNTDFLTRIATNIISLLNQGQLNELISLAKEQEQLYTDFANKRMILINAFRQSLEGKLPANSNGLNKEAVIQFCGDLYAIDGELSYRRAEVMGSIIRSFTAEQKQSLEKLRFGNSATWPYRKETLDKQSMSHRAHVGVMTYASELFSWYKGSLTTDVYFCPERHGTYFGGFYLKDYPAMHNPGYSISTSLTGESGKDFLELLNPDQRKLMETLPALQKKNLDEMVSLRTKISQALRQFITGEKVEKEKLISLVISYGKLDGEMSWHYNDVFTAINKTLTEKQKGEMKKLRNLDILPTGTYLYSEPVPLPGNIDSRFLFFTPGARDKKGF